MRVVEFKGGIYRVRSSLKKEEKIGHRMKRNRPIEYGRETVKEIVKQ